MKSNILIVIVLSFLALACEEGIITEADRPLDPIIPIDTTLILVENSDYLFAKDSVLVPGCAVSGCHNGQGLSPDLTEGSIKNLSKPFIDIEEPWNSRIIRRMRSGEREIMPPLYFSDRIEFSEAQIQRLENWIAAGAPVFDTIPRDTSDLSLSQN
ncbi:MAG: hypothetical protein Kapaf2KO_02860 [Candidatus Kapaibacteriales bacterium]